MMEYKIRRHKLMRPSRLHGAARFLGRWWWYLVTLLLLLLTIPARMFPGTVEAVYSRVLYPAVAYTYGALTSLFPFSLTEAGILILAAIGVYLVVRWARMWMRREGILGECKRAGRWIARGVSLTVAVFMVFCGYNYYRLPFADTCGLTVRRSAVEELYDLCGELTEEANRLRAALPEDELGVMRLSESFYGLARQARQVYGGMAGRYDTLPAYPITPKPVLCSWAMSLMQITGVFCPVTFESNVNIDAPDYTIPATMCHELSHTRGYMREDEANFIAYLACRDSESVEFRYSGVMLALIHAQNRMASADRELYWEIAGMQSEGVRRDFDYNDAYWARLEGPVAQVSTVVNDTYLRLNDQEDGVQSYGRMVDLLLADYRARHGLA